MTCSRPRYSKVVVLALTTVFVSLVAPLAAHPQQTGRAPRLGYLAERPAASAFDEAFLRGLRELGYVDGKNIVIEYRWAGGKAERLPALAAELVGHKVDIIVTSGIPAAKAAKNATPTIPIVMATSMDAVADGLVASFARPGGNITGLSLFVTELSRKRLEVLKEAVPGMERVGALFNALNPATAPQFQDTKAAGETLGLKVVPLDVRFPEGIEPAFAEAARRNLQGVVILSDSATITHRSELGSAALKHRLPTMFANKAYLEGGGLMSYGPDILEVFHRAAYYVDKVLKGAKPADLPIEQPARFELVINLKTAKALELPIPRSILSLADQVIQ